MSRHYEMNLSEFQEFGFLQEANRQFFHPLGLALTIEKNNDEITRLYVQDWRDDPEGGAFETLDDSDSREKANRVAELHSRFAAIRTQVFGWSEQPIGHSFKDMSNDAGI